jgi:hypothetical protein
VASSWSEMMVPPVELVGGDVSTASTGMPLLLFLVRARARCAKAIEGRELEHRDVWNVAGGLRRWVRAAAAEVATEDVVVMATAAAIVVSCVFLAKTNSNSQPSEMQGPRSSAVTDSEEVRDASRRGAVIWARGTGGERRGRLALRQLVSHTSHIYNLFFIYKVLENHEDRHIIIVRVKANRQMPPVNLALLGAPVFELERSGKSTFPPPRHAPKEARWPYDPHYLWH